MNSIILPNIYRLFGLILFQGLVFQSIGIGWERFPYVYVIVFPIFIFLLPLRTPIPLVVLLGFFAGILVDVFYDTLGLHASATVFTAYARTAVLKILEPRGGYNVNLSPTAKSMGVKWYFQYAAILMFLHLFFYFSAEAFTFVFIVSILKKTIVSFVVSMFFVAIFQLIFNPKE